MPCSTSLKDALCCHRATTSGVEMTLLTRGALAQTGSERQMARMYLGSPGRQEITICPSGMDVHHPRRNMRVLLACHEVALACIRIHCLVQRCLSWGRRSYSLPPTCTRDGGEHIGICPQHVPGMDVSASQSAPPTRTRDGGEHVVVCHEAVQLAQRPDLGAQPGQAVAAHAQLAQVGERADA